jgi:hypothetical protein
LFLARPSKIYPNWDFWFENKPSGNPDMATGYFWLFDEDFFVVGSSASCNLASSNNGYVPVVLANMESGLPDGIFSNQKYYVICVNFGGSCNGRCWYILLAFGLFYVQLIYIRAICYFLF